MDRSDDFGPLSCNAAVAKRIMLGSQHIVLVIRMEFPSKHFQVSLLLTRKKKLPKCQEIPIISAGGRNHIPLWM